MSRGGSFFFSTLALGLGITSVDGAGAFTGALLVVSLKGISLEVVETCSYWWFDDEYDLRHGHKQSKHAEKSIPQY